MLPVPVTSYLGEVLKMEFPTTLAFSLFLLPKCLIYIFSLSLYGQQDREISLINVMEWVLNYKGSFVIRIRRQEN